MLFIRNKTYKDIDSVDIKKLIFLTKKTLPDMVYNMGGLEGNPFTYPEVETLLDGITVGGHKLSDHEQILSIKESFDKLFELIIKNKFDLSKETFNILHYSIAKHEALIAGDFRDDQVRIGGTEYLPPKAEELEKIFNEELTIIIERCSSKTELAFEIFLWVALNQFYYDGNKRTGRIIANGILLSNGQGILNVKVKDKLRFNTLMLEFYNTHNADNICEFLFTECLIR